MPCFSRLGSFCLMAGLLALPIGQAVEAAGPFDGNYRGTTKLVSATRTTSGDSPCAGTAAGTASARRVVENKIRMTWGSGTEYEISVAADGTISGNASAAFGQITNTGKITGNSMVIDFANRFCNYRFEGTKGG